MIYLSLPYFYENLDFYNILKSHLYLYKQGKENIFNFDFEIEFISGSFPFSYWNGGINCNYNPNDILPIHYNFNETAKMANIPLILNCSNSLLKDFDIYDKHLNTILDIFKNRGTYLEVLDTSFYKKIKEKYPNYKFILSKNNQTISDLENFCLIQILPSRFQFEDLKELKNKNKYQIVLAEKPEYLEKISDENLNQISFSSKTNFQNFDYFNTIDLALQLKKYYDIGFNHFIIDEPPLNSLDNFNNQLLYFLVKPEFHYIVRQEVKI